MNPLRRFAAFWYDFLIGDRPELFAGAIAVLAVVGLAIRRGLPAAAAGPILVLLVVGLAGLGVWLGTTPRRTR